ncbi:hypothetical protein BUE93_20255 [Chromobacterium amazonense]|uniref:DUF5983 domain-containing protein n=2 Tax=Chromobacterium amazonense TaxID=1382803 RepID=A0A2S9WZ96_9NEIS|nr:hypothetical protein BUE93_20255 [Chromobacterium amazonense]
MLSLSHLAVMTRHYLEATAGDRAEPLQSAQAAGGCFVRLAPHVEDCGFPELRAVQAWLRGKGVPADWVLFHEDGAVLPDLATYHAYSEQDAAEDATLTPTQLFRKYAHLAEGHPCLRLSLWRDWVSEGETLEGYWAWVADMLRDADYACLIGNQTA